MQPVLHERILAKPAFALSLEAHALGSLDSSPRAWFQLRTKPDAKPPGEANADAQSKQKTSSPEASDVLVEIPAARLIEIRSRPDGYYAVMGVSGDQKEMVNALVSAAKHHVGQVVEGSGDRELVSPLESATGEDLAMGIAARLNCKISVFAGRMTAASITSEHGEALFRPGSKAVGLCEQPPAGVCDITVHMMGFWHDEAQFGPLLYLRTGRLIMQDGIPEIPETPLTSSVLTALGAEEPAADPLSPTDSIRSLASTVECGDEVGDEYGNKKDIAVAWATPNPKRGLSV